MDYHEWIILIIAHSLAIISPGPDFVMAVKNSIVHSRRAGIYTALGFSFGILVHVTYCLMGIATIISQSILIYNLIKYAGAAYLIYIGIQSLRSKGFENFILSQTRTVDTMTGFQALRSGFITNLFNPKATLFFLALFTQIISPHTPVPVQILYASTCFLITFTWFSLVAIVLTQEHIRQRFTRFTKWIDRFCGAVMIALGLKIALTKT